MSSKLKILYLVSFAAFLRPFAQVIYVPSLVTMRTELETTTLAIGLTMSVYGLVLAISQLAYGPIVDRFDSKRILLIGLGLFSLSSLIGYLVQSVELLLIARGLQALGIAAAAAVGIALISDLFSQSERGRAMGVFSMFNSAGSAAGPMVGAGLAVWLSWRADMLALAFVGLALVVFTYWQLPSQPIHPHKVKLVDLFWIARTPATFGAISLGFIQFYALYTTHTLLPILLTERLGLRQDIIGIVISLLPIGVIVGTWLGGRLADQHGLRYALMLGALSMTFVYIVLTALCFTASLMTPVALVAGIVFVFGTSVGFGTPAQLTIMVEFFPNLRGTAGALQFFARFLGSAVAPILAGVLVDQIGLSAGFAGAALFLSFGVLIGFLTITNPSHLCEVRTLDNDEAHRYRSK